MIHPTYHTSKQIEQSLNILKSLFYASSNQFLGIGFK